MSISVADLRREEANLRAFTRTGTRPTTTFSLVLAAVTAATFAMEIDAVAKYSHSAFIVGLALTIACAIVIGRAVDVLRESRWGTLAILLLPTGLGATIGMVVQALVLAEVGTSWPAAIKDLGGLVTTRYPLPWIASGIVLGGFPALAVTAFLLLAGRVLKSTKGHDASESYGVAFVGAIGLIATLGWLFVNNIAEPPLFAVSLVSAVSIIVAFLVDGSRARFLRNVYAGGEGAFDIVPRERFAHDASLAPMIARAGSAAVLVRVERVGSYRGAAAEPIALLGKSEKETLSPLVRRRQTAAAMLVAMGAFALLAFVVRG